MSSKAKRSQLAPLCAATLSVLIMAATLPSEAQRDQELDNWIMETGSESQPAKDTKNQITEADLRKVERRDAGEDNRIEVEAPQAVPAKKIAQSIPAAPAVASKPATIPSATSGSGKVPLLKGEITYCVPRGTPLKLKLATVPMPQLKSEIKDEEGNYRPAQVGELITAKITEDIYVDDNKVIPEGTVFIGKVSRIAPPRHVGRPGHLELSFDKFKTPDGRMFAFRAEANNFHASDAKSKLRGAGRLAAHGAGGAITGTLVAYKLFGMHAITAMHGYPLAAGAAIGCAGGIAYALWKRGPQAVLEPGDEFAMNIDTDLLVPAATAPTVKAPPRTLPGFEMEVLSKKIVKDGFGGHMIRMDSIFTNHSRQKLTSIDLFLEDDLGNRYPVSPDIEDNAQEIFYINPLSRQEIVCSFTVEYPKLKHKIIWVDHNDHHVIFEQKL